MFALQVQLDLVVPGNQRAHGVLGQDAFLVLDFDRYSLVFKEGKSLVDDFR